MNSTDVLGKQTHRGFLPNAYVRKGTFRVEGVLKDVFSVALSQERRGLDSWMEVRHDLLQERVQRRRRNLQDNRAVWNRALLDYATVRHRAQLYRFLGECPTSLQLSVHDQSR